MAAAQQLADTGIPVRLLHGDRDKTAPLAAVQELSRRHGWPLTVIAGAGHRLVSDHPQACAAVPQSM